MKYLRKFNNQTAYTSAKGGNEFYYPCVSLIDDTDTLMWDSTAPPAGPEPFLRFTAVDEYSNPASMHLRYSSEEVIGNQQVFYSTDEGITWVEIDFQENQDWFNFPDVSFGNSILIKGKINQNATNRILIFCWNRFSVSGNLAAWWSYDNLSAIPMPGCCAHLFDTYEVSDSAGGSSNLYDVSGLVFPESTAEGCYSYMFCDNLNLQVGPTLPAITLTSNCYDHMFYYSCLSSVTMLATNVSASNCLSGWLDDTWPAEEGESQVLYKNPSMSAATLEATGEIPEGWTIQDYVG